MATSSRLIDLVGRTFGRLTVIKLAGYSRDGRARWSCRCQCGNTTTVLSSNLRRGLILSCGCLHQERSRDASATHGQVGLPEFECWRSILRRCNNPKALGYDTHGGRGIQCLWATFDEFVGAVGERPTPQHRLYRLDRDGHFSADNCAWLLPKEHYRLYTSEYRANLRDAKKP